MGDVIEKNIFEPYGPYGKAVLVQLEKTREILIGAEVYKTAYEEAIRKWRRNLGELYAFADMIFEIDLVPDQSGDQILSRIKKLIEEMDQTVKQ